MSIFVATSATSVRLSLACRKWKFHYQEKILLTLLFAAAGLLGAALLGLRDEFPVTSAPALFAPNAMGFHDFAGNVSEWVNDRYLSFVPSAAVTDPLGPDDGKAHAYRGSNWRTLTASELRFPWREGSMEATDFIGFRVARYVAADQPEPQPQSTAEQAQP